MPGILASIPENELLDVLDIAIWNTSHAGPQAVAEWMRELSERPDADTEGVRRAIAACREYLAEPGSDEEATAAAEAWPTVIRHASSKGAK
jgi:hypothetical protein